MLRVVAAALSVVALAIPALSQAAGMSSPESALLRQMNVVRVQHGLGRLAFDSHLEVAARAHSRQMVTSGVFEHGAFASRMARFRIQGSIAGENLAWGTGSQGSARGVVAAWLASPEHRATLLSPKYRRIGIGSIAATFLGHRGARVITADFAG